MLPVIPRMLAWTLVLLAIGFFTRPASAQVWVDANDLDGRLPDWVDERYVKPPPPTQCEPQYRRVWVAPCYRIVCKRVWVPPVVRVVYERVWVPPRYEIHETVCWEDGVKVIRRERVCVEPGHYKMCRREIVECPGHWKMVETKELVSGGYWKMERV